jgi:5-methylcytosine-specific restriction endonuclease McrA
METDHIIPKEDGGSDDIDNAIPVCLECHAEIPTATMTNTHEAASSRLKSYVVTRSSGSRSAKSGRRC